MALRDYITCRICSCKYIYDGDARVREAIEATWGEPEAICWTVPDPLCPECDAKREQHIVELNAIIANNRSTIELLTSGPLKTESELRSDIADLKTDIDRHMEINVSLLSELDNGIALVGELERQRDKLLAIVQQQQATLYNWINRIQSLI